MPKAQSLMREMGESKARILILICIPPHLLFRTWARWLRFSSIYFLPHPSPTAGSWSHWPGGTLLGRRPTLRRLDLGKSPAQALEAGALRLGWKFWGPQYPECDLEEAHRPQVCIFP